MSKNEFDDLLLRKFQQEDFPYHKKNWEKLEKLLPPGHGNSREGLKGRGRNLKKWQAGFGIAAGIALLLTMLLTTDLLKQVPLSKEAPLASVSENQSGTAGQQPGQISAPGLQERDKKQTDSWRLPTASQNAAVDPQNRGAGPQNTAGNPILAQAGHKDMSLRTPSGKLSASSTEQVFGAPDPKHNLPSASDRTGLPDGSPPVTSWAARPADQGHTNPDAAEKERSEFSQPSQSITPERTPETLARKWSDKDKESYYNSLMNPPKESVVTAGRTTVSVGGGVNYGTLNTGYALGLSARQKIGDRFFVEGSVGMLYNNNARNVADYNTISGFSASARPSTANAMKLNSPAISPVENLYYFQVNPAVGYAINEQVALSVGGDLQHLITADAESPKVQYSSEEVRIFPALDFGLTGKTEFSITPEIQAGILYREGLSAWLQSDPGTTYLNRRYIQVQFKYSLPVGK